MYQVLTKEHSILPHKSSNKQKKTADNAKSWNHLAATLPVDSSEKYVLLRNPQDWSISTESTSIFIANICHRKSIKAPKAHCVGIQDEKSELKDVKQLHLHER